MKINNTDFKLMENATNIEDVWDDLLENLEVETFSKNVVNTILENNKKISLRDIYMISYQLEIALCAYSGYLLWITHI